MMSGSPFGILESRSSKTASEAQVKTAEQAAAVQLKMYNQSRADLAPWRKAGAGALNALWGTGGGLIRKGPGEFKESEGYQWTLGQGLQAQQRAASATGRLGSGDYIKDATKYAEGLASTEYDK